MKHVECTAAFTMTSEQKPDGNITPCKKNPQRYIFIGNRTTSSTIRG